MALTATRLSPGVYSVNGKTIKAATSDAAITAYNKQYGTPTTATKTTASTPTTTSTTGWNQTTANELAALKDIPVANLSDAQKNRIWALEDMKKATGATISNPLPRPAATTPAPPVAAPAPVPPPAAAPPPAPTPAPPPVAAPAPAPPPVAPPTSGLPDTAALPAPVAPETPVTTPIASGTPLSSNINTAAPGLSTSDASAIERAKAILGIGETFGRGIANEFYQTGSLGRQAETNTPEELLALQQAKEYTATVGNQTDAVRNLLAQQQGVLGDARQLSPLELEALGVARSALPGLEAPEMEALRSAARQNIVGQQQAALRDLAKTQARNQVFGSAATAQRSLLGQQGIREGRNLERDLLVKNIEIKQAAQNAFTGLATNTEANRASRTNAASGQLANTTLQDEAQRNAAKGTAINSQATIAGSLADRLRQLREFNLGQAAAEKAGQVGSIFGGIGAISEQRGLLAGETFADAQLAAAKKAAEDALKIYQDAAKKDKL